MTARAASFAFSLLASLAPWATAQEKLQVEPPSPSTIRLGDTARATIRIEGREAAPRTPQLPEVPGLELTLSPPSRSSHMFFDGRRVIENVGVQYQLLLRPLREGVFTVPSFAIWTGTREQNTPVLQLEVRKDMRGEELAWLDVQVEPRRVYVHEPVRISVELGIEPGLRLVQDVHDRYRYLDVQVQAPWLDTFPGGEKLALPDPKGDLRLIVANNSLQPAFFAADHERAGRRWHRYRFERAFLPTRIGTLELSAPMLRYQVLLRQGQIDVFGGRRGEQAENYYVYGEPITLEVLPIPEAGRPNPYYGAVGRFTLDAALDRSRVDVGASVKLTLTVRGQGNFEFLRLPELDRLEGFHLLGQAETRRGPDGIVVTYDLVPQSADVTQVPPIRWNYFDTTPGVEKFVEVTTRALPLEVRAPEHAASLAPLPNETAAAVVPGVDDVHDLPDLAGPPARRERLAPVSIWLAVGAPWLLAALFAFARRRARARAADPLARRARAARRECERALGGGADPSDALAAYVGDRLGVPAAAVIAPDLADRLQRRGLDAALAADVAAAIERGTAARYGGGAPLDAASVRELVQRLERSPFGVLARLLPLLLPLAAVLATGGPLAAQHAAGGVEAAVAAYRAGDYATAEAAFADAFAATGDRRLVQARGNCFYRLQDLPRALWAYESARLGLPRDEALLANIALVRRRLQLGDDGSGFSAELRALRDRLLPGERLWLCALGMTAAAGCLVLGWRRAGWRWVGAFALVPSIVIAADLLWWGPRQPARAIAFERLQLVSEPRAGLDPVATVRPGVEVELLGSATGAYVRVAAGERTGYAPSRALGAIE